MHHLVTILLTTTLLAACHNPRPAEGLACSPGGLCPEGQTCGPDGVCRSDHAEGCTPGSCEDGFTCNDEGQCVPDDDEPLTIDNRSHVGRVLSDRVSPSTKILGTMVSSRVVLTCRDCLGGASVDEVSFTIGGVGNAVGLADLVPHPSEDVVALHLDSPMAQPSVELASAPPEPGSEYVAVIPDSEGDTETKYKLSVTVQQVAPMAFEFMSARCPAGGGPTFGADGTGDLFLGVHASVSCSGGGGSFRDARVDALRDWILQQIEDAEPETCEDAEPTCPGTCGVFECSDETGEVVTSCEPDDGQCSGDRYCDPNTLTCKSCTPDDVRDCGQCGRQTCTQSGDWGACEGTNSTLTCGSCGRNYCQLSGNYGGCTAVESLCGQGESCEASGSNYNCETDQICTPNVTTISCGSCGRRTCNAAGTGYGSCLPYSSLCSSGEECQSVASGVYECVPVTCSTAPYDDYCELTGETPPSTVSAGDSWLTGSGCLSGGCRSCSCSSDGTVDCSNGCLF